MVNSSKIYDSRIWAKWRAAGAIGTIEDACNRETFSDFEKLVKTGGAIIDAIGINYEKGLTTLSICKKQVNEWSYEPAAYLVVPNSNEFYLGQKLKELPSGAMSVERAYPKSA